jgi:hypothetical protein
MIIGTPPVPGAVTVTAFVVMGPITTFLRRGWTNHDG